MVEMNQDGERIYTIKMRERLFNGIHKMTKQIMDGTVATDTEISAGRVLTTDEVRAILANMHEFAFTVEDALVRQRESDDPM